MYLLPLDKSKFINTMANAALPGGVNPCDLNDFKFSSSLAYASHLLACILSGVILLTTIGLNSLTVLTFWRTPRLRENLVLYLVMILSLVDVGIGAFCNPLVTISLIYDSMHSSACWIYDIRSISCRPATILSLSVVAAISTERYFGVVHPLLHRTKMTKVKLSLLFLLIWLGCIVLWLPTYLIDNNPSQLFAPISIVFLILITICSYTKIAYTVICSKIRREGLTDDHSNADGGDRETAKRNRKEILHFLKELKMAKSCFLIVLCYLMCYTPTVAFSVALRSKMSLTSVVYVRPWCLLFIMLNSSLNSIIFFWRSALLRNETNNVLKNIRLKCSCF